MVISCGEHYVNGQSSIVSPGGRMLRPAQSMTSSGDPYPHLPNMANSSDPLRLSMSANIVSLAWPAGLGIPMVTAELWTRWIDSKFARFQIELYLFVSFPAA
jgi:hypothetical protein